MKLIEFTPEAIKKIKEYHQNLMIPENYSLRIGIKQKNASDKGLIIGFDLKQEKDSETEIDGIKIIYHPGQIFFFAGMIIDFGEKNGKQGFLLKEKNK